MSWYREQKEAGKLRDLGKGVGMGAIMGLPLLSPLMHNQQNPVAHPAPMVQLEKSKMPEFDSLVTQTPGYPQKAPKPEPKMPAHKPSGGVQIDPKKIIAIESSGNPKAVSGKGAAGLMGLMPATWDEIVKKMGKNYSRADMTDGAKNIEVGNYYFNTEVPKLLKSFGIPDSVEARIGAYNWGIGHVAKLYKQFGDQWLQHAPVETQNYIKKYHA